VRLRTVMPILAAVGVLTGCDARATNQATPTPTETRAGTTAPRPTTPRARPTTAPVVTRDGACPYFGITFAQQTIGQHLARSTVTTTRPYPGCTLYRPDGGKAIDIQIAGYPTALAAQQKAVTALGPSANPTDVGDHATVAIVADGARLVASRGRYLVAVFINQQSSLQAHDIAAAVAIKIH
jgi:hypothetical protein